MEQNLLKRFREKHGLTQSGLGIALGIDAHTAQSRISHYETGKRDIPTDVAYSFLDYAKTLGEDYALENILPRQSA